MRWRRDDSWYAWGLLTGGLVQWWVRAPWWLIVVDVIAVRIMLAGIAWGRERWARRSHVSIEWRCDDCGLRMEYTTTDRPELDRFLWQLGLRHLGHRIHLKHPNGSNYVPTVSDPR